MRGFALVALAWIAAAPARADCDHFKWSVADERTWFAAPVAMPPESGVVEVGKGYQATLAKDVKYPVAPERAPAKDTYGAVIEAPKLAAGLYQVTLSQEAWIDLVQDGKLVKSSAFSGQRDCPGVRKSVRFPVNAGDVVIEISNATAPQIVFALAPAK